MYAPHSVWRILTVVVNPITRPTVGDVLVAGGSFNILVPLRGS